MESPISASQGAMRSVLSKLNLLLEPEHRRLQKGQKNKIRLLQRDLEELMSKYFIEPSDVEAPASTAECWVKQLRELSYDIDDFLDKLLYDDADATMATVARKTFHVKIARLRKNPNPRLHNNTDARITSVIKTCRFKIARLRKYLNNPRRRMTDEISEFRSRVEEAIQQHWIYNLDDCSFRPRYVSDDRPLYPPPHGVEAAPLVDIDRPKNKLHEWLTNDEEKKLMVVSIVGSGGVGKTTLANELYKLIAGRFECRAYVRTSRKPDLRRLLTSMLSQIQRHQRVEASGVHDLIDNIREHLRDKRYFVIIDDLWALSTWDIVSRALTDSNRCSRILITTEFDIVAQACCGYNSKYIFKMEPLSEDGSRELFFNRVFGRQHKCPEKLNEVSYEIVRKCGGLPLATLTISGLLPRPPCENMEQHWNYVQNSLSYNMRTDPALEGMKQVLKLSYNNFPHRLKACMLYLSLYQEDYIICKDDLVKQWIAEGFIEGEYMEEVAWSYFDELINRGMIQPADINYNGDVLSCTVHYMILNLIRYKSIEENFITAIDHSQTTIRLADKVRRLALHFGNVEDVKPPANMRLSQVRSLAFYGLFKCMPSIIEFKLLRVLFLKLWVDPDDMIYDLTEISTLFRLTYLHIDACLLRIELPAQMQRLKGLMTLKIAARVSAIPSDIVHLPGLLHLSLPSGTNLPNGICHMTSLRTLGYFDLSSNSIDNVESLGKLTNLRDLQLTCSTVLSDNLESNMQRLGSILGKLSNLESLTLLSAGSSYVNTLDDPGTSSMSISCDGLSTVSPPLALLQRIELLPRYCIFSNLPEWIGELSKLCILKIAIRKLSMADIAVLKGLPALTTLSLYVQTAPVERIDFDKAGFSVLKYFKFRCSVPWLKFEADAIPNLRKLKLAFNAFGVGQHGTIPISIEHLSGVKEISAKIGSAGADAESALASAVSNHPSNPRINVQLVDWHFYGDEGKNMVTQEQEHRTLRELDEIFEEDADEHYGTQDGESGDDENTQAGSVATQQQEHGTLEEQYEILEEDPDEYYKTADEESEEDENKQADIRISRLSESSSCLLVPGMARKLSLAVFVLLSALLYQQIQPPPPKICGSPNGPPVTGPRTRLKDGRHLAYLESGVPKEKAKYKIIFVHGFDSCRYEALPISPELEQALGIYLLSFDRPGYAESDPHPDRTEKSIVLDIEELADNLQLGPKFYLIGFSMGGQIIWSCLKYIPHRLSGVAILGPVGNYWWSGLPSNVSWDAWYQQLPQDQWAVWVAHHLPWLTYWWNSQKLFPASSVIAYNPALLSEEDKLLIRKFAFRTYKPQIRQQGEHECLHRDMMVGFGKWKWSPLDLRDPFANGEGKVHLWHGAEDLIVPVSLSRYISEKLPWVIYHELPMYGHFFPSLDGMGDIIVKSVLLGNQSLAEAQSPWPATPGGRPSSPARIPTVGESSTSSASPGMAGSQDGLAPPLRACLDRLELIISSLIDRLKIR